MKKNKENNDEIKTVTKKETSKTNETAEAITESKTRQKNIEFSVIFFLLLSLFSILNSVALTSDVNPDIWWMLTVGRNILTEGFSSVDTLTVHDGLHSIAQQWLTDVLYYKIYEFGGIVGLRLFAAATGFVLFSLIFFFVKKITNSVPKTAISVATFLPYVIFLSLRPSLISSVLLFLVLVIYEEYFRGRNYLWGLPIISVLLINLHGAFWPVMLIFSLPYLFELIAGPCVVKLFENKEKFKRYIKDFQITKVPILKPVLFTLSIIPVALINPYGLEALMYGFKSTNNPLVSGMTQEMRSLFDIQIDFTDFNFETLIGAIAVPVFVTLSFLLIMLNKNKKMNVRHFCLLIGLFFMSCVAYKYTLLYIIAIPVVVSHLPFKDFKLFKKAKPAMAVGVACFAVIFLGLSILFNVGIEPNILGQNEIDYIVEHEDSTDEDISVLCFNEGGYAEFNGLKPYMDTRMEVFIEKNNQKADLLNECNEILYKENEPKVYDEFFEKYEFDYVLAESSWSESIIEYIKNNEKFTQLTNSTIRDFECTLYAVNN